ncbi:MAG TPA: hypothetical protein GXX49_10250 [Clostridiaceae bacterium]|nr:hypothetical protein [Clostridiaceae bacterium]
MIQLRKYEDFVNRVNELGFMALSDILTGFPSLSGETPKGCWHSGDPETDPWCWKDRVAEEKQLAFGCILGGHKGFISPRMYSIFFTAFHPEESMEERRESGCVSQTVWQLWQLFERKTMLNTSEIRREMGVTLKKGGSKVDKAIQELQKHFYITVAGNRRKTDKYGKPYGWASNVYDKVENWAPREWMQNNTGLSCEEARERILDIGIAIGKNINRKELARVLGIV